MWKYYSGRQPGEMIRNGEYGGHWWTDSLKNIGIQLTADAVKTLFKSFMAAYYSDRPLTFFIQKDLRAKWRRIVDHSKGDELYLSEYGERIFTKYDPYKIKSLRTNSINTYYHWEDLPTVLKQFILQSQIPEEKSQTVIEEEIDI